MILDILCIYNLYTQQRLKYCRKRVHSKATRCCKRNLPLWFSIKMKLVFLAALQYSSACIFLFAFWTTEYTTMKPTLYNMCTKCIDVNGKSDKFSWYASPVSYIITMSKMLNWTCITCIGIGIRPA